jgi:hypothetical protein
MPDAPMDEAETFNIYFSLEQGQKADIETVSHALLEFAAAVREAAFFADPSLDLRIELASGKESSLDLKTLFRVKGTAGAEKRGVLLGIAIGASTWLGGQVGTDLYNNSPIHKMIAGDEKKLSEEDVKRIAEAVAKTSQSEPVRSHVQSFYRALDRDTAIAGVGASLQPNKKPDVIVPSTQFRSLSGVDEVRDITTEMRERITRETVVLVAPVLLESNRKWRFRSGTSEFGASIDDQKFLLDVLTGRRNVPMRGGILMDVELKTLEEKTADGLWKPIDRHIMRIFEMREPAHQSSMDFSAGRQEDNGDEN